MPWSTEEKAFCVEDYFTKKSYNVVQANFRKKFQCRCVPSKSRIFDWVQKFKKFGTSENLYSKDLRGFHSGRKVSVRTEKNIDAVRDSVARDPAKSIRQRSQELGISRETLRRVLTCDLHFHSYNIQQPCRMKFSKGKKSKDADKPKKAMSAYFYFKANCREQAEKAGKNVSKVAEFTKECSKKWKNLSAAQRKPFNKKAAKDKARYEKEMAEYKGKSSGNPDKPKRQPSFSLFLADFRKNYVPESGKGNSEYKIILKEAAEKWRNMSLNEKRNYKKKSEEEVEKYEITMTENQKKSDSSVMGGSSEQEHDDDNNKDKEEEKEDKEEDKEEEKEEDKKEEKKEDKKEEKKEDKKEEKKEDKKEEKKEDKKEEKKEDKEEEKKG